MVNRMVHRADQFDPELHERLTDALDTGKVIVLPFGLTPATPPTPHVSEPLDLGVDDPHWTGFKIIVDQDMEIGTQELALNLGDESKSEQQRLEATYAFLERVLVAWNFTERDMSGAVTPLAQPREGGVRRLRLSQLKPIVQAVGRAIRPDPN